MGSDSVDLSHVTEEKVTLLLMHDHVSVGKEDKEDAHPNLFSLTHSTSQSFPAVPSYTFQLTHLWGWYPNVFNSKILHTP